MVNSYAENLNMEISQQNQHYIINLIITDGIINDMNDTIDEIVRGSSLPLSVIIIGVGSADFDQMEALDGDGAPLYSNRLRRYRERDIVQFVPFSALKRDPILLAKEVMAEIPRQLTDFFQNKNIVPNPKAFQDRQGLLIRNKMRNQMAMMMGK